MIIVRNARFRVLETRPADAANDNGIEAVNAPDCVPEDPFDFALRMMENRQNQRRGFAGYSPWSVGALRL